eukprot:scaffold5657_cov270-Pinguiococcus_pyrenoidosus.AAC.4
MLIFVIHLHIASDFVGKSHATSHLLLFLLRSLDLVPKPDRRPRGSCPGPLRSGHGWPDSLGLAPIALIEVENEVYSSREAFTTTLRLRGPSAEAEWAETTRRADEIRLAREAGKPAFGVENSDSNH